MSIWTILLFLSSAALGVLFIIKLHKQDKEEKEWEEWYEANKEQIHKTMAEKLEERT